MDVATVSGAYVSPRRGWFSVDFRFFDRLDVDEGVNLFHRMVVIDVQHKYFDNRVVYHAIHPGFRAVTPGEIIPEYRGVFSPNSIYPTWVEVTTPTQPSKGT